MHDPNRADRRHDFMQPRCDGDNGMHDGAVFEHFIDQRIFVWRGDAANELFF
jgi:hypothetical protein